VSDKILDNKKQKLNIWLTAWIVAAVFILTNLPTPLYPYWQDLIHFNESGTTVIFAAYIIGLIITLSIAGQLSVIFGHKSMLIFAIIMALMACILFGFAQTIFLLILARILTSISSGIALSVGMAAVMLQGRQNYNLLASLAASVAMIIGADSGPLLSGLTMEIVENPVLPIFALEFILLCSTFPVILKLTTNSKEQTKEGWKLKLPSIPKKICFRLIFWDCNLCTRHHFYFFYVIS